MTDDTPTVAIPRDGRPILDWLRRCDDLTSELRSVGADRLANDGVSTRAPLRLGESGPQTLRETLEQLAAAHLLRLTWTVREQHATLLRQWVDRDHGRIVLWPWVDWPRCSVGNPPCGAPATHGEPRVESGRLIGYFWRCARCVRDPAALPLVRGAVL